MRPRPTPVRPTSAALLIVLAGLLGACASDDEPSAVSTATTAVATTTTATATAPTETTATTEMTPVSTEVPAPSVPSSDDEAAAATRAMFAPITPDVPGCTVAVARRGEVVFAEAYGAARLDPANRTEPIEPMTAATVVDIGSTSKQFTATALLLLAERDQIDLDAPLSSVLVDLPDWADLPTLRQVMHHESGIPDYIGLLIGRGFSISEITTDADALDALAEVTELEFEPGTSWAYSNSNYFLMGQVVLAVTGDGLGTFLADEVFTPLGLDMVMDPTAVIPSKAISYEGVGDDRIVADSPWQQLGDGAIQTTPSEVVRWASEYWAPTLDGITLDVRLDRASVALDLPDGAVYGAGIMAMDDAELGRVLRHSGAWGGFVTVFSVDPAREVAIAATCTSPDSAALLATAGDPELELLRIWALPA